MFSECGGCLSFCLRFVSCLSLAALRMRPGSKPSLPLMKGHPDPIPSAGRKSSHQMTCPLTSPPDPPLGDRPPFFSPGRSRLAHAVMYLGSVHSGSAPETFMHSRVGRPLSRSGVWGRRGRGRGKKCRTDERRRRGGKRSWGVGWLPDTHDGPSAG